MTRSTLIDGARRASWMRDALPPAMKPSRSLLNSSDAADAASSVVNSMTKKDNGGRSESDAALAPPPAVRAIARKLERAGFETWCVGGAVRDALLGERHLDWDLATAALPQQVRRLFRRTIPVGIQFGTVGVLDDKGTMHEVTTFRRDVQTDGRHAVVEFGASLDDDLARRDFTINAIAYSPSLERLHDPFGGREDLRQGLVRAVGDPRARMREDRLRALRAIRFAARFGFEIEHETWDAIVDSAPHLGRLSAERVRQEIEKTMEQVARPSNALEMWRRSGALAVLVPALAAASEVDLRAADCLPRPGPAGKPQRLINRICSILLTLTPRDAQRTLRQLRFSNAQIAWCVALVDAWERIGGEMRDLLMSGPIPDRTVRQWVAAVGRVKAPALIRLAGARFAAERDAGLLAPDAGVVGSLYRRLVSIAFREPVELSDLAVDGDDLRAIGVAAGPFVGRILSALLEWVLDDPGRNTREQLIARAMEIFRRLSEGADEG